MKQSLAKASRFLSLVLRHQPQVIGLTLDTQGWAEVEELLERLKVHGKGIDRTQLVELVETNDKQRFKFNGDRTRIRANQGHSISIDLGLVPQVPPCQLFHGTAMRFLASIRQQGLLSRSRQHVHLSRDRETALKVGQRHGKPIILTVNSGEMSAKRMPFFLSENGVWLTEIVPVNYINFTGINN